MLLLGETRCLYCYGGGWRMEEGAPMDENDGCDDVCQKNGK